MSFTSYAPPTLATPAPMIVGQTPLSTLLDWYATPNDGTFCEGYYREASIDFPANLPGNYYNIHAKQAILYQAKPSVYLGGVVLNRPNEELSADKATTYLDDKTHKISHIQAEGNVRLRQPGILAVANNANLNVENRTAVFNDVAYRVHSTPNAGSQPIQVDGQTYYAVRGINARGTASKAMQLKPNIYKFEDATFSTCDPTDNDWEIDASDLEIDRNTDDVVAHNAVFKVKDVPVMYTPYFSFNYSKKRKSGFLFPNMGFTGRRGFFYGQPYYWNMAPNYDLLLTPYYMTKSGYRVDTDLRYLTWNSMGEWYTSYIPYDRALKSLLQNVTADPEQNSVYPGWQRALHTADYSGYTFWQNQTLFDPYWKWISNINYASNDYYFYLYGNSPSSYMQNQLQQSSEVDFDYQHWSGIFSLENYQTLHPLNSIPVSDQYARWPQINLAAHYPHSFLDLDYDWNNNYTNFHYPIIIDHVTPSFNVVGQRFDTSPSASWPGYTSWGYVIPKVEFEETSYRLSDRANEPNYINRGLPISDIDAGLYFDRTLHIGQSEYTETLEPRLFYLYVPYTNQDDIPIFDTAAQFFTFESVFATNRFDGIDRVGDANQIGAGVTTRFINQDSGNDIFDASIGELFYFADRRVNLAPQMPLSSNNITPFSPIAGQLTYYITPTWSLTGNLAYNPIHSMIQNGRTGLEYYGDHRHILNFSYSYQRGDVLDVGENEDPQTVKNNTINILTGAAVWPFFVNWSILGAYNYDLNAKRSQTYIAGVEYDSCCWAVRLINTHTFTNLTTQNMPSYDTAYIVQFALTGLGTVGSNDPTATIAQYIPGFTSTLGNAT